ncbi:MAG: dipeptide ABC transporter ATP-binding protein, partial [Pseudoclavibacter sp.]
MTTNKAQTNMDVSRKRRATSGVPHPMNDADSPPGEQNQVVMTVEGLRVAFLRHGTMIEAVNGVDFRLRRGRTLAIIGESGSGKSVSVRSLMGLLPPSARVTGSAKLGDTQLLGLDHASLRDIRGRDIAMVFQNPATSLNPTMSIGNQLLEAIRVHSRMERRPATERAMELLDLVRLSHPELRYKQFPHQLSGGMRQRVVIAMALASNPKVLIADEATTALDVTTQAKIMELLGELQTRLGMAIILISHDISLAASYADDVMVMRHGSVVEHVAPELLFDDAREPYTKELLGAFSKLPAERRERVASVTEPGDSLAEVPILSVRGLVQEYVSRGPGGVKTGVVRAVNDVSFDVMAGTTLGIVGETGSGKSTIARAIVRVEAPKAGTVTFQGTELVGLRQRELAEMYADLQMIYQDPFGSLNPRWRIGDVIAEPLRGHTSMRAQSRRARVDELLDLVGLPPDDFRFRRPQELSGGQAQRVAIARAVSLEPALIVCDEATSSLDVLIQAQILKLLARLQRELHLTCLFIGHDLNVVRSISDTVAVMHQGNLVEFGRSEQVFTDPQH